MKIYNYKYDTKEFLNEQIAKINPLKKDEFLLPKNSTTIKPPLKEKGFIFIYNENIKKWEKFKDFRGQYIHDINTKDSFICDYIGELKQNHILGKEESKIHNFDIYLKLDEIDKKKVRAITDFLITNDNTRLLELEKQANDLRSQLL